MRWSWVDRIQNIGYGIWDMGYGMWDMRYRIQNMGYEMVGWMGWNKMRWDWLRRHDMTWDSDVTVYKIN